MPRKKRGGGNKEEKMIEELINTLRAIEENPSIEVYDECIPEHFDSVRTASDLAAVCLVVDGRRDWNAELRLQAEGFRVVCVERDSFGWLVGGIETSKGLILYG